jgi:hypothetical protein
VSTLLHSPLPSLFHPWCELFSLLSSIPRVNFTPFPRVNSTPFPSSFRRANFTPFPSSFPRVNFTPFPSSFSLPSLVSTLLPSPLPTLFHPLRQLYSLPSLFHPWCQLYSMPLFLLSSIPDVNFTPFPSSFSLQTSCRAKSTIINYQNN